MATPEKGKAVTRRRRCHPYTWTSGLREFLWKMTELCFQPPPCRDWQLLEKLDSPWHRHISRLVCQSPLCIECRRCSNIGPSVVQIWVSVNAIFCQVWVLAREDCWLKLEKPSLDRSGRQRYFLLPTYSAVLYSFRQQSKCWHFFYKT